jgi:hypothetical protein
MGASAQLRRRLLEHPAPGAAVQATCSGGTSGTWWTPSRSWCWPTPKSPTAGPSARCEKSRNFHVQVLHLLSSTAVHRLHCSSKCYCSSAVRLITMLGVAHVLTACDALQASIEYSVGAGPTKFAVGCEEGMIYSCNRRCAAAVPQCHVFLDISD